MKKMSVVILSGVRLMKDGKFYEEGEILEMDEYLANQHIEMGNVVPLESVNENASTDVDIEEPGEESKEESEEKDLYEMSYKELQKQAKELGLNAGGTKEEIIDRINDYLTVDEENIELPDTGAEDY